MENLTFRMEKWIIDLINRVSARADGNLEAWQRKIERRFTLELDIDSNRFSLHDETETTASFVWANIVEIQSLRRNASHPECGILLQKAVVGSFPPAVGMQKCLLTEFMHFLVTTRNRW